MLHSNSWWVWVSRRVVPSETQSPVDASHPVTAPAMPVERSWNYLDEPQLPPPLLGIVESGLTYAHSGTSPTRPFASNVATPGSMLELSGEVGIVPRLSLVATGVVGQSAGEGTAPAAAATAGLRVSILPVLLQSTHLVLSAG